MTLHERIAAALGWTVAEAQSMSFKALRELVRPVSPKLAYELTCEIQSGAYLIQARYDRPAVPAVQRVRR